MKIELWVCVEFTAVELDGGTKRGQPGLQEPEFQFRLCPYQLCDLEKVTFVFALWFPHLSYEKFVHSGL